MDIEKLGEMILSLQNIVIKQNEIMDTMAERIEDQEVRINTLEGRDIK